MSDFNGRIGEILRAVKKNEDPGSLSYVIRKVLRAECADGWKEGYSDGQEDAYLSFSVERDALRAEIEALKADLIDAASAHACEGDEGDAG